MSGFRVGDVCVVEGTELNGRRCEIIGPLENFVIATYNGVRGFIRNSHLVRFDDGEEQNVNAKYLRKIDPPSDSTPRDEFIPADPAAWDLTMWSPNKVKESV